MHVLGRGREIIISTGTFRVGIANQDFRGNYNCLDGNVGKVFIRERDCFPYPVESCGKFLEVFPWICICVVVSPRRNNGARGGGGR